MFEASMILSSCNTSSRSRPRQTVALLQNGAGDEQPWCALAQRLGSHFQTCMLDRPGHGNRPARPAAASQTLGVDAQAVWAVAGAAPVHLVGYGYGAALALQMALADPNHVLSLTLYEPLAFGLLPVAHPALEEMQDIAASVTALVGAGRHEDAARVDMGYWGSGAAWARLQEPQRAARVARMQGTAHDLEVLLATRWDKRALAALRMPVLLLCGAVTRAPARAVHQTLADWLPQAQTAELPMAGHLGPQTHTATFARWTAAHLNPALAGAEAV